MGNRIRLPVKFLMEFSCRPGSRFLPFGAVPLKQKQRSAFLILAQAKQFPCFPTKLKPRLRAGLMGNRIRLPVKFLTEFSCRPGSRFLPFGAVPLKQKQRSAFLILAQAKQFACFPTKLKPRLRGVLNFGRNRIRTYVGRSPTVLQTVAFDRSAILPNKLLLYLNN